MKNLICVFWCLLSFQLMVAQKASEKLLNLENMAVSSFKNKDSLKFYANKILQLSLKENAKREEGIANNYLARVAFLDHNYDTSEKLVKKAISIFKVLPAVDEEKGESFLILGRNNIFKQEYDSAFVNFMKAKKLFLKKKKLKNPDNNYFVSLDIAYLYIVTDRFDEALTILNSNLKKDISDDVLATTYSMFSILANYNSDYNESIKYFKRTIPIYQRLKQPNAVLICEMDIAINYFYLGNYDKTISNLKEILSKVTSPENQLPVFTRANLFLSKAYFEKKNFVEAQKYFEIVESVVNKNEQKHLDLEEIILENKVNLLLHKKLFLQAKNEINNYFKTKDKVWLSSKVTFYEKLKIIAKSLGNSDDVRVYNDSINKFQEQIKLENKTNSIELLQAEFKYFTAERELELKTKEYELLKIKERNSQIVLIFLVCIGVLSIVFFSILYSRKKKINEMREAIFEKEKQYLKTINHQKLLEIDYKDKEIVGFAIHISEKNEILNTIKSRLKELTSKEQLLQSKIKDLILFINNTISQNSEKVTMYSEAEEIKELFLQKIKIEFPDLTDKEIRVAILVKMQLTSKQIGQQLNITPASVDNYRSVLRRKMNIPKDKTLLEFLNELV